MPFNPNYEIPAGTLKPAVVGTPISADDWNAFITDLETSLTDTLRATTQAFVGQVFFDDTAVAAAPAVAFTADTDTGVFQKGANELGFATGGTERVLISDTAVTVTDDLAVTGDTTLDGNLGVTGDTQIDGNLNVTGTINSSSHAALVRSNSSSNFAHTGDTTATDIAEGVGGAALTATIIATGKPVLISFQSIPWTANPGFIQFIATSVETRKVDFLLLRDGTTISKMTFGTNIATAAPLTGFSYVDTPAAGSHIYKVQVQLDLAANTIYAFYSNIVAYEL